MQNPTQYPTVLILGSGIAGLTAALKYAETHPVWVVTKDGALEGATRWAQGGIASVWSKTDSFTQHVEDTLLAGAGLCHPDAVKVCVEEGPERVRELIQWGVPFTKREPSAGSIGASADPAEAFDLHREGGHRQRRILHADDLTGLAIAQTLLDRVRAHPNIRILEHHVAIDLVTEGKAQRRGKSFGRCLGVYVLNSKSGEIHLIPARITLLCTGGAGKAYLYTSNPDTATGDGIAMAYRAGARVANLEFMQFHPTCLYHPGVKTFLISEAVRGEGAVLLNLRGEEFMKRFHEMSSLAPRDVVARAIDSEMKRTGDRHVWLDTTRIPKDEFRQKFPNIYDVCIEHGIDPTHQPIPVVPAAHYTCGGVLTDLNGATSVQGLYAIGEAACTGLHGANRLASNSLLEGVVFAHRAFLHGSKELKRKETESVMPSLRQWSAGEATKLEEQIDIAATWLEIRTLMWNYVGIVRSDRRLERARRRLDLLKEEVNRYYWEYLLTKDLIELRNLVTVADLIVQCAILRKESRGLHYTTDYPQTNDRDFRHDTVL